MDETLALHPLHALLPLDRPFTRTMARSVGVERAALERMLRDGTVVRLVRGVYAASSAPATPEVRAAAVALAIGRESIAVDRTAAWVHGVDVTGLPLGEARPLEVLSPGRRPRGALGSGRQLSGHDVVRIEGLRLTTPLRTALDLGRLLPPDARDRGDGPAARRRGLHPRPAAGGDPTAGGPPWGRTAPCPGGPGRRTLRGTGRVVAAAALARGEAADRDPGLQVCVLGRLVRLSLGVERRQFGAVLAGQVSADDLVALQGAGWWVVVLSEERLLRTDPELWMRHLEREFHQHLLAQMESDASPFSA